MNRSFTARLGSTTEQLPPKKKSCVSFFRAIKKPPQGGRCGQTHESLPDWALTRSVALRGRLSTYYDLRDKRRSDTLLVI